jgi:hypothetical protein
VRSPEEVLARHRANLEAFVLRARRVEAHSLAQLDSRAPSAWQTGLLVVRRIGALGWSGLDLIRPQLLPRMCPAVAGWAQGAARAGGPGTGG